MKRKDNYRVCIISEFPPPNGGISQQAQILFESLKKENIIVRRVAQNGYLKSRLRICQNVKYIKSLAACLHLVSELFLFLPKVDVIHILTSSYLNFFIFTSPSVFIGKLFQKKIIIHYHGGAAEDFLRRWHLFARIVLRFSNQLVFPSEFLAHVFKKFGLQGIIIPNILNLDNYFFLKRKKFFPKYIVTRHLRPEYNVACVIRAFAIIQKEYPEALLKIAGDGPEKSDLIKLTQKLELEKSVNFLGQVPNEKMPELYKDSDFVLNASIVDNMPVSIMESFACGCPVITTAAGGIPYLVKHRINGFLVDLNDHAAIAREALWALSHQEDTVQIVMNASREVFKFSWNSIRKSLFDLYGIKK